jgi:regulator of sigma E protease
MNVLYSILSFTIVLGIIVLVHEFGHYIAARLTGVRVETFSFGFGKRIFGKKIGDTDFRLSLIPLGGYVKMAGEEEWDPENLQPDEFQAKNRAQKIFILAMGSIMNLLLAFFIFAILNMTGVKEAAYKYDPPRIGYVEKGSPAEAAGIRDGDIIRAIDGGAIENWRELEMTIGSSPNSTVTIQFERNGTMMSKNVDVKTSTQFNIGSIGVFWDYKTEISRVVKGYPAAEAGLKPDDIILGANGEPLNYYELFYKINEHPGQELTLRIKRGESELDVKITPRRVYYLKSPDMTVKEEAEKKLAEIKQRFPGLKVGLFLLENTYLILSEDMDSPLEKEEYARYEGYLAPAEKGIIGIDMYEYSPSISTRYGLFAAFKKSASDMVWHTSTVFKVFKRMIVGKISPKNLSGPLEIAKFSKKAMDLGATSFFMLIAFISLQLGFVNLLPIPALDGGHLLITSIEAIIRREFSQKVKGILLNVGFALLIALMSFVILNDIAKNLPNGWNSFWPF